jgi:hypothetical protein
MSMRKNRFWITLALLVLTAACHEGHQTSTAPTAAISSPPPSQSVAPNRATDKWLGKWIGPEGTFLLLSKNGDKYAVKIQSLDGPETFEGVAAGDRIQFQRNGKTETIRAGNGKETGMKWLMDEKDCLIINEGEGYCRKQP